MSGPGHDAVFTLHRGETPLVVSLPHVGIAIPEALKPLLVDRALEVEDTDWHLDLLYDFARELGASLLVPLHSRYVVDLNRPAENTPMYAGANNTGLLPATFFTGEPIYRAPMADAAAEIARRLDAYWRPYHAALEGELARVRERHGHAVLWDGHSIRSQLPWLFEGRLPDLNLGTVSGASCAASLRSALMGVLERQHDFSHVTDGRFKGGHITRRYGRPADRVHAAQLEMCWSTYMAEEPPYRLDPARVAKIEPVLRQLLLVARDWTPDA